jgi:hypothetical protein
MIMTVAAIATWNDGLSSKSGGIQDRISELSLFLSQAP